MKEKRPTLCIVAGPNGSGKTSTTEQYLSLREDERDGGFFMLLNME